MGHTVAAIAQAVSYRLIDRYTLPTEQQANERIVAIVTGEHARYALQRGEEGSSVRRGSSFHLRSHAQR